MESVKAMEKAINSPKEEKIREEDPLPAVLSPQRKTERSVNSDEENWKDEDADNAASKKELGEHSKETDSKPEDKQLNKKKTKKRKRNSSDDDSSSSESSSSSDEEKLKEKYDVEDGLRAEQKAEAEKDRQEAGKAKREPESSKLEELVGKEIIGPKELDSKINTAENDDTLKSPEISPSPIKRTDNGNGNKVEDEEKPSVDENKVVETETIDLDKVKDGQPRALHRTSSIFLRNLAPSITRAEIEAVCNRFTGYLRVAIADPLVERRWYRRGWITFMRDVNIKEICWGLNNQRLRDCEMGAIVNRDLSRRVRPANGITAHKQVVRSDIKLCAKIALNLDERFRLWAEVPTDDSNSARADESSENGSGSTYGFNSKNPVLQNITDYLIEEASAEEDELLGLTGENKDSDGEAIERDEQLICVLDRLVLYLRIVHSVDYYNHCEYPYEDEMPNRCGIIHARGPAPVRVTNNDVQEYIKTYESKLQQFLTKTVLLSDEEIKNLGAKDAETEVEKFVQANTQELAKDKWLCPLSGKKFKGPEFIRKHIFNKHDEKVDEVRKEVQYFNNYLRDPKRPQLPEHPGTSKRPESESVRGGGGGYRPPMYPPFSAMPYGFGPPMMGGGRGGRNFPPARRELPLEHQRRLIGYHDLDAPANSDMFD
ncbi:serrate RNA effector molecule homolog isoform X5 [Drosophila teissieri]|nr:serrate RNA effector molecule homolog isoform X5 [Drosophila teissieri]